MLTSAHKMFREDKIHGGVVRLGGALVVVCTLLTCSDGRRREFFKPPSSCLTGASCALCEETARFFSQEVCCYQCRLDNVVIDGDLCHCINTRVADPPHIAGLKVRGNCSRGKACDNCSVKISTDASLGARASPGIVPFCCPDCGLVVPYFQRDEHGGCYCDGDPQGREHEVAPRYDPSKNPTTSTPPPEVPPLPATAASDASAVLKVGSAWRLLWFCCLCTWAYIAVVA